MSEIRKGRHCVFCLHAHLVFVTKYRRGAFDSESLEFMEAVFSGVCKDFGATLREFNGEADHVHLLVDYPPKVCLSKLVNSLKGVSSRLVRQQSFSSVEHSLKSSKALWSPSYFAGSCGGAPLDIIKEYIQSQRRPS